MEADELSELMGRYSTGDDGVFEDLYRLMAPGLGRFCARLAVRRSDACDVFQETFMRVHRARATFIGGSNPLQWAFAIARSVHIDRMRYWRRRPERLGPAKDAAENEVPATDRDNPEAALRARDVLEVASLELERMPEKNRVAYTLIREQGLSVKDAAAMLGLTAEAVNKRAHRAYEQLRAALGEAGWSHWGVTEMQAEPGRQHRRPDACTRDCA